LESANHPPERNGALLRVHAIVCSKSGLTLPTVLEMGISQHLKLALPETKNSTHRAGSCSTKPWVLRGYTVSDVLIVVAGVISHTNPTARFQRIRYVSLFALGEILPRIVSGDSQKLPRAAFEMLEQYVPTSDRAPPIRNRLPLHTLKQRAWVFRVPQPLLS
jgi:hypothetical protein